MNIVWNIEPGDTERIVSFVDKYRDDPFVKERVRKNLQVEKALPTRDDFWYWLVACLLSTQQRSGPGSPVTRFLTSKAFPLDLSTCLSAHSVEGLTVQVLGECGGIRRGPTIGKQIARNLHLLEAGGWQQTFAVLAWLRTGGDVSVERRAAAFIDEHFSGFGPKQSRNLLQSLGLTRYEIPIDSRITKWLNEFGFPLTLSAGSLADRYYYEFVSEGLQHLCKKAGVFPCVLDAAIFTSFDAGGWTDDMLVW